MNNSSAYNNVLLKPSVQTQAAAPAPKCNYQDDQPSASFQQNFKDVHDSVRAQDEKIAKSAARKTTQADNRKPANDVEKKSSAPAKQTDESRSRDQVADNKKATDSNESQNNQNTESRSAENQDSKDQDSKHQSSESQGFEGSSDEGIESKSVTKKINEDEQQGADALLLNPLVTNTNMPVAPPVSAPAPVDEVLATAPVVNGAAQANTNNVIATETLPDTLVADVDASKNVGDAVMGGVSTTASSNQTNSDKPDITDGDLAGSDAGTSSVVAQQPALDVLAQSQVTSPPEAALTQDPTALAAVGSALVPKPVVAQATLTPVTDEPSDIDALSAQISPLATEKVPGKVAATGDLGIAPAPDANLAQSQVPDSKSTFEKTFQNLTLLESGKREDNAALPPATQTSSTNSSSTNALDSMLRFSDAQTPAARSFVVQTAVPVPVGQPQWSQAVGEKVLWLAAQNVSSAEIHLNPENLGPVQVKVSVNQEQTTINFTSHHAVVREVLDQNLGRLRDMFSEQGLNLVNVDVSDKSFSRQQSDAKDQKGQANTNEPLVEDEAPVAMSLIKQQRLVDHYA